MPPFKVSFLIRVSSPFLNPHKHWYVLVIEMCGMTPAGFCENGTIYRESKRGNLSPPDVT